MRELVLGLDLTPVALLPKFLLSVQYEFDLRSPFPSCKVRRIWLLSLSVLVEQNESGCTGMGSWSIREQMQYTN